MKLLLVSAAAAALDRHTYIPWTQIPCRFMAGETLPLSVQIRQSLAPEQQLCTASTMAVCDSHAWAPQCLVLPKDCICWGSPPAPRSCSLGAARSCTPHHSELGTGRKIKAQAPEHSETLQQLLLPHSAEAHHVFLLDRHLPDL